MDAYRAAAAGPPPSLVIDGDTYLLAGDAWSASAPVLAAWEHPDWPLLVLQEALQPASWGDLAARCLDMDDPLDLPHLAAVVRGLVAVAYGRPWHVAARLVGAAVAQWEAVDGRLAMRGIDLLALLDTAPARAANLIYALLAEGCEDEAARMRLDAELERPAGLGDDTWDDAEEGAAFMAAMQAAPSRQALAD